MTQKNKIEAIRVKLKSWENPDLETLILYFEKVPNYITSRDFSKATLPISVFTDFGYLEVTLNGNKVGDHNKNDSWLNDYIDNENVFIEEEIENSLTFWGGEFENRYDWTSGYFLSFNSKVIRVIPLSAEEWKKRYVEMTLSWEKIHNERYDLLEKDFLQVWTEIVKGKIKCTTSTNRLSQELDEIIKKLDEKILEIEKFYNKPENSTNLNQQDIQTEMNHKIKGFWQQLIDCFK